MQIVWPPKKTVETEREDPKEIDGITISLVEDKEHNKDKEGNKDNR